MAKKLIKEVNDTGRVVDVKDSEGKEVERKIYEIVETFEVTSQVNYEGLLKQKADLEAELARINALLNYITL